MLSMIANPVTALPVVNPRSGLSRSDLVLWPTASDVAVQANVGLQVNCGSGSRVLETLKMTLLDRLLRVVSAMQHGHVQPSGLSSCDARLEHTSDQEPACAFRHRPCICPRT
jgi:hypothetical protein